MSLAFRPTFTLDLPVCSQALLRHLLAELENAPVVLRVTRVPGGPGALGAPDRPEPRLGSAVREHLTLTVPEHEQHFWSPWLTLEISPHGNSSELHGRFSPHPAVWSGFMFAYLGLSVLLFFALVFALALWLSGSAPWTLGLAGLCAAVLALLWWASQVGQRLASAQMEVLRAALDAALKGVGVAEPQSEALASPS